MNICEGLSRTAQWLPDQVAVVFQDRRWTYAKIDALSQAAAHHLQQAGLARGDRVALMLPNAPCFIVWYYAVLRLGAIAVSVSTRLAATEVRYTVSDCQARAIITDPASLESLREHLPSELTTRVSTSLTGADANGQPLVADTDQPTSWVDAEPDEAALILYTSGTTGFAKGATLSHNNVRTNVCAFNHLCGMQAHDRLLLAVPLFHCFGQNALLNSAFNVGATLVLQEKFDLNETKHLIAEQQVTQLYGVPMMFQLLLDSCQPADLATVNYCFSAAAKLPIQIAHSWQEKFGLPIHEGYGLTETSPFASYNHRLRFVPGSIGTPIDGVEMKIVDTTTGEDCAPGELGEIAIRGPNVMLGYWNRPEESAAALRDGWFLSGDIGRQDEDGFFYLVDRVKDMISIGGMKVFPAEVERLLQDHPGIAEVAVVGVPDPIFGEQVVACVVATASTTADQQLQASISQYAHKHLGHYKLPRQILLMDELPRNPSGKILKTQLRELVLARATPADTANPSPAANVRPPSLQELLANCHAAERLRVTTRFLQQLVQEISPGEALLDPHTRLMAAGLDSLMLVDLSTQLGVELGQPVSATLVFDYPAIADLAEYLVQQFYPSASESSSPTHLEAPPDLRTEIANMSAAEVLEELQKEVE